MNESQFQSSRYIWSPDNLPYNENEEPPSKVFQESKKKNGFTLSRINVVHPNNSDSFYLKNFAPRDQRSNFLCEESKKKIFKQLSAWMVRYFMAVQLKPVSVPTIPMIPTNLPFHFRRFRLPVKLCFSMTTKKTQDQTFNFFHGQLYVALSRVSCKQNQFVLVPEIFNA